MSQDSKYKKKSHNVSVLLYHIISSVKYRRVVVSDKDDKVIVKTCEGIELRYEINFLEVGTDNNHVHFLVKSVPTYCATKL